MSKTLSLPRGTPAPLSTCFASSQSVISLQPGPLRAARDNPPQTIGLLSRSLLSLKRPGRSERHRQLAASVTSLSRQVVDLRSIHDLTLGHAPPRGPSPPPSPPGTGRFSRCDAWHQKVYRSLKPKRVEAKRTGREVVVKTTEPPTCFLCSGRTCNTGFIIVNGFYMHFACLHFAR